MGFLFWGFLPLLSQYARFKADFPIKVKTNKFPDLMFIEGDPKSSLLHMKIFAHETMSLSSYLTFTIKKTDLLNETPTYSCSPRPPAVPTFPLTPII